MYTDIITRFISYSGVANVVVNYSYAKMMYAPLQVIIVW